MNSSTSTSEAEANAKSKEKVSQGLTPTKGKGKSKGGIPIDGKGNPINQNLNNNKGKEKNNSDTDTVNTNTGAAVPDAVPKEAVPKSKKDNVNESPGDSDEMVEVVKSKVPMALCFNGGSFPFKDEFSELVFTIPRGTRAGEKVH